MGFGFPFLVAFKLLLSVEILYPYTIPHDRKPMNGRLLLTLPPQCLSLSSPRRESSCGMDFPANCPSGQPNLDIPGCYCDNTLSPRVRRGTGGNDPHDSRQ